MASVNSLGIGSGVLTSELVEDLIAAEREVTDLRLTAQRAEVEARISAFGAVRSGIDSLINAASTLGDSRTVLSNVTNSTNANAVTATATSGAVPSVHTVEVLATARAHTLASIRFDSPDAVIGEGTLDFRFGTTTFNNGAYDSFTENPERASAQVVIDATNNSVAGVRDAINNADIGVNATVVNDGEGFVLVLTSDQTGADNSLEINVTEGAVTGLSALAFNAGASTAGVNLTQTVNADDAVAVIDGITITRESNTVDEVIAGVTFNLLGNNAGAPATVTVSQDTSEITGRLQAFVDAYNDLRSLTDDLTEFDEDAGSGSLLTGNATIRNLLSQLNRFLNRGVDNVESTAFRALVDLGISRNQNLDFQLQLDVTTLQSALASNADDVVALLAAQQRTTDDQIRFIGFQNQTLAGSYDVNIEQAATQATLVGQTVAGLANPITIDADNDTLAVSVDGVDSGVITLAQGSYDDGDALALELQSQINQDANLRAANRAVEVTFDAVNNRLEIASSRFGSGSSVGITQTDVNTLASLGLDLAAAEDNVGLDVIGTVNGISGIGSGQFLTIPNGPVPATAGVYQGSAVTSFTTPPLTVDGSNSRFSISVDGTTSADINLTPGSYSSGAELASEIQAQINADPTLSASAIAVQVRFDAANSRFEISSETTGPNSSVNIVSADAGVVADLGLGVGVGVPGAAATSVADPAAGIQLQVQGEQLGERGSVTLVRGVANQIDRFLSSFIGFGGTLTNTLNSLDDRIRDIEDEQDTFNERIEQLEARLRSQFAAADALIATLNNTSSFLDQQLAALPGFSRDDR